MGLYSTLSLLCLDRFEGGWARGHPRIEFSLVVHIPPVCLGVYISAPASSLDLNSDFSQMLKTILRV